VWPAPMPAPVWPGRCGQAQAGQTPRAWGR
jgi:hypothetical protein